jgi:hypothetical protein
MRKAIDAVGLRMAGGWLYGQGRHPPTADVFTPASIEDTLGILPQQVKPKISAEIL